MELGKENFDYSYWGTSGCHWDESSASKERETFTKICSALVVSCCLFVFLSCGSTRKVVVREEPTPRPTIKKVEMVVSTPPKTVLPTKKVLTNQEKVNQYIERFGPIASHESIF